MYSEQSEYTLGFNNDDFSLGKRIKDRLLAERNNLYAMFVYSWKFIVAHNLFIYFFICLTDNTLWESWYASKRVNIIHAGNEHKVKKDRVTKILYVNVDFAWRHMEYRIIREIAGRSIKIEIRFEMSRSTWLFNILEINDKSDMSLRC